MGEKLKKVKLLKFILVLGLAILSLAILMFFLGTNAQADIIVPMDQPTIQDAIDAAIPGENIYVWNGTYNENITVYKSVHLIGNGSATTIIDGFGTMNNIINITAEGVEITGFNITESGNWYGIWANVGGFSIHDNVFDTQNSAVYMDITRLNSGSITVGDIIVDNNEVIGTHGFLFNIEIEEPLSSSDFVFGKTVITNNTLYNTQNGIDIYRYAVHSMDQGSVTWDDIIVKDNFINLSNSEGIKFWGIFWNITDVNIDVGKIDVSNNNITAQYQGIYIEWWDFCDGIYGNTIATTQDTYIYDNTILSLSHTGIGFQTDVIGNIIYDSTSITTGDFYIYSNNITSESTVSSYGGIYFDMDRIAQEVYNDSSVNFGNIYIDSNNVDSSSRGIYFNIVNSFGSEAYDNALVNIGDVSITNNEILSVNQGVYISFNNLGSTMHDQASVTLGNFIINNNNLSSGDNGIYIDMDQLGFDMHDSASMTMGHFTIDSNNITSVQKGIFLNVADMARNIHNDSIFAIGDFTLNYNTINSTTDTGIEFWIQNSAYTMTGNASATFDYFYILNNNITANNHGLLFAMYNIGFEMYDGAAVTLKDFYINDNILDCPNGWVLSSDFIYFGIHMYGNSSFSIGNWYAEGNIILSGQQGIWTGPQNWGNYMYDNSVFTFGDFFVRNNVINVTLQSGIKIMYTYNGGNMAGSSQVTGGNVTVTDNNVSSRDLYGLDFPYVQTGYENSDFSYVSTGWIDISYNNFSSVNNHGTNLYISTLGCIMYGNSQVFIGDIMFTHNDVWSDTEDALHFANFFGNAYQMHNDTYFQIGNVLVNDNYLNAGGAGDGIELYLWQQNAYEMSHNASADFGNFEFNNNIITAGRRGITFGGDWMYWGNYLRGDNHVTFGHFSLNDNIISTANGDGIDIGDWYSVGEHMYGHSTLTMGNIEIMHNNISTIGGDGINAYLDSWGYRLYDYAEVHFGNFLFNDNVINSTDNGIYIGAFQMCGSYVYNNSIASFGNIEINGNQIIAGSIPSGFNRGIYFFFYENCYDVFGNPQVYFGHVQINDNTITCYDSHGIYVDAFYEIGANYMQDNAYFEMGNFEVQRNWIDANESGLYIAELAMLGYEIQDNSSAVFGDFLFDANTIYAGADGIYINAFDWARAMTGTTSATFGDFSVSNNIIESQNQGLYFQFENAGYDMHDMSRFEMGSLRVLNNTIISGQDPASVDSYGILFRSRFVGYEMYNESQAIVGSVLVNNNTVTVIFGTNANGVYINWISNYGASMNGTSIFTMNGNIEVCRNTINTTNGDEGISCNVYNLGNYLYGDITASYGDFLFNNNTIIEAYNDGIRIEVSEIGYYTYGNSSVTIGNVQLNDNDILLFNGGYYAGIELYLRYLGSIMYDDSIFNMGYVQMNDNIIYCVYGLGFEVSAYRLGYQMYNGSSAYFGDFEFLRNNIISKDWGIRFASFNNNAADLHNDTMVFFGNFLINNNIINTTDPGSDGISFDQPRYVGYEMYDQSHAELGNFEFNGNEITVDSLADGIDFQPDNWGSYMYDNATFTIGDFSFIGNSINANSNGIYFQPSHFGSYMYGNSSAHFGKNEIMHNTLNSTGGSGIESWWWDDFGSHICDYSYFEVGSCYIMFNNITSWSPAHNGIYTGPYFSGSYVSDESQAHFGDYIVSHNTVFSNGRYGIYFYYEGIGFYLDVLGLSECRAVVEVGEIRLESNIITVPQGTGIYFQGYDVAEELIDFASVNATGIYIANNTIIAFDYGINFEMQYLGYNLWNESQANMGPVVIEKNNITSTNGTGIKCYIYDNAYFIYNDARLSIDDIHLKQNTITASTIGIDIVLKRCINILDNSTVVFPGMLIVDNLVDSAFSAFNYTTFETPGGVTGTATLLVGDVIIQGNTFDGGLFGMLFEWQNPDPTVQQPVFYINKCDIIGGSAGSKGLLLFNITDVFANQLTIDTFDYGIYSNNSHVHYYLNGSIENCTVLDISLYSASYLFMVNSTFDNSSVFFEDYDSLLEVAWFMNVLVQSQVALPVPEAMVAVADVDGTEIFNAAANTDGQAFFIICMEYQENITGIIKNYNDYTANATKGVDFGVAVPNPTMNQTRLVVITLTDFIPPTIFSDNSDTAGTTGDPFYFEINATDNVGIVSVHVNYRLGGVGPYTNLTMSGTGPYWLNEILPTDYAGFIEYYFTAVDSGGFWVNTTPKTAPVTDNDAPTIISDNSDTMATTGETFNFIVDAIDNIDILEVRVVWWFGAGAPTNDTMSGIGPYTFSIPVPLNSIDQLHYYFTMNDTEGNWLVGPQVDINVTDNDPPTYTWVSQPSAGTTGESVPVSILATDNIDITYYKIDIDGVLYDLIKDGDYYNYTIIIPADSLASITYNIVFNDSANNPNSTAPTVLTVTDNDAPTYTWVLQPITGTAGGSVLVSLRAFDNIGVAYYKIEIDGTLYDLVREGDYFNYTINIPPGSSASITYDIIFKDAADNEIATGDTVITVTVPVDNVPPEYNWVLHPDAGTTGESVLVSLLATDNIGITYYKISIDGTLYDLVKDGDYYNYTINIPTDSLASITYFVVFNDSANNPNTATDTVITITDNDPGTISNPASDTSGQKGKEFRFQIDALDNIGISEVKVWYWFGDDDSQKKSLTLEESDGTYSGSFIPDESGTLHYYFEVTDEAGNTFESSENTVDIASEPEEEEANILPWIILIIVIVIVLLLFFLTKMRKKEPEELPAEPEEGVEEEEVEAEPEEDVEEDELELGGDGKAESEEELEDEQIDEELEEKEEELEKEFGVEEERTE